MSRYISVSMVIHTIHAGEISTCGPVFFMRTPTRSARLTFIGERFIFGKVGVATYFILF